MTELAFQRAECSRSHAVQNRSKWTFSSSPLPEMLVRLAIQQRSADVSNSYLPWAYFDRRFVPVSEARLPVGCHAVQYGQGVFAGIRGYLDQDGSAINVFRLPDHFKRFVQSASIIKVTPPGPPEALAEILVELTRRNAPAGDVY